METVSLVFIKYVKLMNALHYAILAMKMMKISAIPVLEVHSLL